ncbi:unnamed protein product [Owenia fusiformis]|uniref:Uncharacterized protein n=1 Tax=Owenia fusiformis TaxID=6347 RepID=A0A8J1TT02_OWEFU|nr:unnamed protein product [Owenia fusiformis]
MMARARTRRYISVGCTILLLYLIYLNISKLASMDKTKVEVKRNGNILQVVETEADRNHDTKKGHFIEVDGNNIEAGKRYKYRFQMMSLILGNNQLHYKSEPMESSLLHEFSPDIENRVENLFIDGNGTNHQLEFYVISPAILPYKGNIMVVARVWLNYERRYKLDKADQINRWIDNYLFSQMFDGNMKPTSPGEILGIPVPVQYVANAGCSDPKIFNWMGSLMVLFYMTMRDNKGLNIGHLFLLDYDRKILKKPKILDHNIAQIDSNWVPLVVDDTLHFVYTMDPLRVLKCTKEQNMDITCHFIKSIDTTLEKYPFNQNTDFLHGGSSFLPYKKSYYINVALSTLSYKDNQNSTSPLYGAHIVLLKAYPFRIVYVSERLRIHPDLYNNIPIVRNNFIRYPFFHPFGLIVENSDTIDIGIHINDYRSFIVRVTGIETVLDDAIATDSRSGDSIVTSQPRNIQEFVKLSLQKSHLKQKWKIQNENGKEIVS